RTHDLQHPMRARYLATLQPEHLIGDANRQIHLTSSKNLFAPRFFDPKLKLESRSSVRHLKKLHKNPWHTRLRKTTKASVMFSSTLGEIRSATRIYSWTGRSFIRYKRNT